MSTLRPGVVSPEIKKLRESAIAEMDAKPSGESKAPELKFDAHHGSTPAPDDGGSESDNWVARYPGMNSEHVGNGSGGPQ